MIIIKVIKSGKILGVIGNNMKQYLNDSLISKVQLIRGKKNINLYKSLPARLNISPKDIAKSRCHKPGWIGIQ